MHPAAQHTAFVFPGQGSQFVGMGQAFAALPAVAPLFEEADDILAMPLKNMMFNGPENTLALTHNTQPALLVASVAAFRYLSHVANRPLNELAAYLAGHSLGEYAALVASGVLSFANALQLVRLRGELMQQAVKPGEGAMLAVLGLADNVAAEVAQTSGCYVANDNAEGQVVLSGAYAAVEKAAVIAQQQGARKVVRLNVSAPFHCPLMAPAAEAMAAALAKVPFATPQVPVVLNTTASACTQAETIRTQLVLQITQPVRWRETMVFMANNGVTHVLELGAGKVLTGLAKRCDPAGRLQGVALNTPEDINVHYAV